MEYLVNADVLIEKPINRIKRLKFAVTANSDWDAIKKVENLYRTKGLLGKEYVYTVTAVSAAPKGEYWKWNGHHFETLKDAKGWAKDGYMIGMVLDEKSYDEICHVVNGLIVSTVKISLDAHDNPKFSKVQKFHSDLPTLA